jgi:hypothetical protein
VGVGNGLETQAARNRPGNDPTKSNLFNFTHVWKIFLQIFAKFLTNLWKMHPTKFLWIFVSLIHMSYFSSILQKLAQNDCKKYLSYQTILIKSNKNVKCASYKYL